jgi:lysophospholipase L1-like esterase
MKLRSFILQSACVVIIKNFKIFLSYLVLLGLVCIPSSASFASQRAPANLSTTTPVPQKNRLWQARFDHFLETSKQIDTSKIKMVFLGDSITQGWEGEGLYYWEKNFQLQGSLNFGINSDKVENVLFRIEHGNIDHLTLKTIILLIGTNNLRENSEKEIFQGIEHLILEIERKSAGTKVYLLSILPRGGEKDLAIREKVIETNELLATLAQSNNSVQFVDVYSHFTKTDGTVNSSFFIPDLIHLNKEGYKTLAVAICNSTQIKCRFN